MAMRGGGLLWCFLLCTSHLEAINVNNQVSLELAMSKPLEPFINKHLEEIQRYSSVASKLVNDRVVNMIETASSISSGSLAEGGGGFTRMCGLELAEVALTLVGMVVILDVDEFTLKLDKILREVAKPKPALLILRQVMINWGLTTRFQKLVAVLRLMVWVVNFAVNEKYCGFINTPKFQTALQQLQQSDSPPVGFDATIVKLLRALPAVAPLADNWGSQLADFLQNNALLSVEGESESKVVEEKEANEDNALLSVEGPSSSNGNSTYIGGSNSIWKRKDVVIAEVKLILNIIAVVFWWQNHVLHSQVYYNVFGHEHQTHLTQIAKYLNRDVFDEFLARKFELRDIDDQTSAHAVIAKIQELIHHRHTTPTGMLEQNEFIMNWIEVLINVFGLVNVCLNHEYIS